VLENPCKNLPQLAHRAYPALSEDCIRREVGKMLANGVEEPVIKFQLLLGGEKTVKEALRQALELQAMLLTARPQNASTRKFWGSHSPPTRLRDQRQVACWSCGEVGHFYDSCPYGREAENDDCRRK
jgi:hypothetical protein